MPAATDESQPFVLAGKVRAWDPVDRSLWIGGTRLSLAPGLPDDDLIPGRSVIVTGYRLRGPSGRPATWVVTQVRRG